MRVCVYLRGGIVGTDSKAISGNKGQGGVRISVDLDLFFSFFYE